MKGLKRLGPAGSQAMRDLVTDATLAFQDGDVKEVATHFWSQTAAKGKAASAKAKLHRALHVFCYESDIMPLPGSSQTVVRSRDASQMVAFSKLGNWLNQNQFNRNPSKING